MKFAIDGSTLVGNKTGIDFITEGVIEGFRQFPQHQLFVYVTDGYTRQNSAGLAPNIKFVMIAKPTGMMSGLRWYWRATRDMQLKKIDVFISTFTFSASLMFKHTIQIVPDLSPLLFPRMFKLKHRLLYRITLWLAMHRAWRLVTISQAVADEIKQKYGRAVGVVPLAINDWAKDAIKKEDIDNIKAKYKLPAKYLLSVSTIQPRKNYVRMIEAFAQFNRRHPEFKYVIVGKKGWDHAQVFQTVEHLNLKRQVIFLNYAPDAELKALTSGAQGFAYCSVYEGFGIPPLNAAYVGIPTLVSDLPVFREMFASDEAVFVDPLKVESIAEGMEKLLTTELKPDTARLNDKYNWQRAAEVLIKLANQ